MRKFILKIPIEEWGFIKYHKLKEETCKRGFRCRLGGTDNMVNCEVMTKNGLVRGKYEDGIYKWFGIPYAKKPLGKERFRRAKPADSWKGILETIEFSCRPVQPDFFVQSEDTIESEDCLYINVWSKGIKEKKPVIIWIYGSAFIVGEASLKMYDGTQFAKDDIVFVSFNHRVGIFGGYDLSHLQEGDKDFDGNIMLSDQIQALRWVHDNIEAFGGDPDDVTLMGESAGGTSVINLMTSPKADGLFQKAICESGVMGATVTPEVGNINMRWLLHHLNVKENELWKLKEMDVNELAEASNWLLSRFSRTYPGLFLAGVTTGKLLPELPLEALKKGVGKGIKLLIGTNADEETLFINGENSNVLHTTEEAERFLENSNTTPEAKSEIMKYYNGLTEESDLKRFVRDINFTYHSTAAADIQCQFADTYMYYLTYATAAAKAIKYGAYHSSEVPFVFDTTDRYDMKQVYAATSEETLRKMTNTMHIAWVNFVKYGNPNGEGNTPWPKYDLKTKQVYRIDEECTVLKDPHAKVREEISKLTFY